MDTIMATVEYQGGLRTQAVHLKSKNEVITDAPLDNNGKGEAFSPTDLVSAALSSCMMTMSKDQAMSHLRMDQRSMRE